MKKVDNLGIDPTAETSETTTEHLGDSPESRMGRHHEYDDDLQMELFPVDDLQEQFATIQPAKMLGVGSDSVVTDEECHQ